MKKYTELSHQKKLTLKVNIVTVILIFGLMLYLNCICPYIADDYHFHFVCESIYPHGASKRISCFSDILLSIKNYYNVWGGRALCHFIIYCLIYVGKWLFNILNSVVFVLFGLLLYKLILKKITESEKIFDFRISNNFSVFLLPVIYILLFFVMPAFGDNVLWLAGSVNYLWSAVFMLVAISGIERFFENPTLKNTLITSITVLVSSLTSETTGGMLFGFMAIKLIYCLSGKDENKKSYLKIIAPVLSALTGMSVVIFAPGNSVRKVEFDEYDPFTDLLSRILNQLTILDKGIIAVSVFYLVALIIKLRKEKKNIRFFAIIFHDFRYVLTGLAGIGALIVSGFYIEKRISFVSVAVIFVSAVEFSVILFKQIKIIVGNLKGNELIKKIFAVCEKIMIITPVILTVIVSYHVFMYRDNVDVFRKNQKEIIELYDKRVDYSKIFEKCYDSVDKINMEQLISPTVSLKCTLRQNDLLIWQIMYFEGSCDKTVFINHYAGIDSQPEWLFD